MPVIATNIAANTALFFVNRNSGLASDSLAKLSSGSRIVKAADDAAGAAITQGLQSDISSLEKASQTISQVDALLQIADGGLQRISEILQRMRALAVQFHSGAVGAFGSAERGFITSEYTTLRTQIANIESSTTYNGIRLLDGTYNEAVVAGADASHILNVDLSSVDVDVPSLGLPATFLPIAFFNFTLIDNALDAVGTARATVGSLQSAVYFQGENIETQLINYKTAKSAILDADIAAEQTAYTSYRVLTEAAIAALAQANQLSSSLLTILR